MSANNTHAHRQSGLRLMISSQFWFYLFYTFEDISLNLQRSFSLCLFLVGIDQLLAWPVIGADFQDFDAYRHPFFLI